MQGEDVGGGGASAPHEVAPGGMRGAAGPLLRVVRDRRIAFLLVGGFNTVFGYGLFALFTWLIGTPLEPRLGRVLTPDVVLVPSHIVSVIVAFVLYRRLVFRVRGHVWLDLARFESLYLVSIGINLVVLPLLVQFVHLPSLLAQGIITVFTTVLSYFGNRDYSFRRRPETDARDGGAA